MKSYFPDKLIQRYVSAGLWKQRTLAESLNDWALRFPDKLALVDCNKSISYQQLDNDSTKLAWAFVNAGIEPNDKLVVQLSNSVDFFITLFALMKSGAIPILALPSHRFHEINEIIKVAGAVGYISQSTYGGFGYNELAVSLKRDNEELVKIFFTTLGSDFLAYGALNYSEAKLPELAFDDVALFLLSGGTTSVPKLIPRSHSDYLYNLETMSTKCGMKEDSVFLAALPVAHNFALACPGALGVLAAGGKVVLQQHPDPLEILKNIEHHRVTHLALVPVLADLVSNAAVEIDCYDLSSLELIQVGGARFTEESATNLMTNLGCNLQQVFGMAEGLLCCTSLDDSVEVKVNTQGRPISLEDEILILDSSGNPVDKGDVGELYTRGPYTLRGYFNAEHHNKAAFSEDGFYRTGDLVKYTPEGNLVVMGRVKELINRAGEKFSPVDVESRLAQHENIVENILVSVPDKSLGERTILFLNTVNGDISRAEIVSFLHNQGVPNYKLPDEVVVVNEFPLTGVGKIDKKKLLESYKSKKG